MPRWTSIFKKKTSSKSIMHVETLIIKKNSSTSMLVLQTSIFQVKIAQHRL